MFDCIFKKPEPQAPLFSLESLKLSEKVHWLSRKGLIDPMSYVQRHLRGDWGDVDENTRKANQGSLDLDKPEGPLFSRYSITPHLYLLVVTSADHLHTVVQLPEEPDLF